MFPNWVNDIKENNKLILTNDLDSLFTIAILKKLFNCQVGMFYDFEALYSTQEKFNKDDVIGVDLAIEDDKTKTFCNHVTKMWKDDTVNPLSANLNNIAGIYGGKYQTNYFRKYSGSTLLTVLSLYEAFDMLLLDGYVELTETQKMILVSVDSYFYGKDFMNGEHFYKWQKALGLEIFEDIFDKYSKQDLIDFQKDNSLKGEIYIDGNTLSTTLDIAFLQEHFPMLDFSMEEEYINEFEFSQSGYENYYTKESKHDLKGHVFSLAVINRNTISYTTI
ncbi:hypothetical protein ACUL41_07015 [Virgibacillus natechei]